MNKTNTEALCARMKPQSAKSFVMPELALWEATIKEAVQSARELSYGKTPACIGGTLTKKHASKLRHQEQLCVDLEEWASAPASQPASLAWACDMIVELTKTPIDEARIRLIVLDCVAKCRQRAYGKRKATIYSLSDREGVE
jgi:hypothetical protein